MKKTTNFVILLVLLLASTLAEEDPKPIFKALGEELEMGYCFGDYIAVYRITAEGRLLLGQSSSSVSPPDAFKGRIDISSQTDGLLSLRILILGFTDSGIYITECKSDNITQNYHKHYLYVCGEEISSKEIVLNPATGADLVCDIGLSKQATTTVKWYRELQKKSLFLDTKTSLEPLQKEFKGLVQVRGNGSLHVSDDFIRDRPSLFCLVMEGEQCRSFQAIRLPEEPEMKYIYRSVGENIALSCSVDHLRQNYWETPFGQVSLSAPVNFNGSTGNQMQLTNDMSTGDYSLVIDSLTSDHSGAYKCFSTILVENYFVNVCPLREMTNVTFSTGKEKVVINSNFINSTSISGKLDLASILWYQNRGEGDILIMDSRDPSIHLPHDLKGRVNFREVDSSLVITHPKAEDIGTYWCMVILKNKEVGDADPNDTYFSYDDADMVEDKEEGEDKPDDYIGMCLYKKITNLQLTITPKPKSEPDTNLTINAVCGVLIVLFVLALIGIVGIKMKAKKRAASSQRGGVELSGEEGKPLRSNATKT